MSALSDYRQKIESKVTAIKNFDTQSSTTNRVSNSSGQKITESKDFISRKIDDFKDYRKSTKTDVKDVFGEVIKTVQGFIGTTDKSGKAKSNILKYAKDASKTTIQASKQMVMDTVKNKLFSGDGVCGSTNLMSEDELDISPKEIDFLNMLTVNPDSNTGKIMYESTLNKGFVKMNTEFYKLFDSNQVFSFSNNDGNKMFDLTWNSANQTYHISGLQGVSGVTSVQDFLTDYYSSIEYPDFENILKQSMLMAIQGDGNDPKTFTIGMDKLERLLQKLFSLCGQQKNDLPLNQNPINQLEADNDLDWYFDLDDVEGIDLDEEDARSRRVLKFKDCNNYEVPINPNHIEDFVYLFKKNKDADDNISKTINNVASETYEKSGQSISLEDFQISLTGLYVSKIPKALISAILSPKIMFPIVVIYKMFKEIDSTVDIKDTIKKLSQLFFDLIKKVFWKFLKEFWNLAKKELLNFIKNIAATIIKNKLKRIKNIIMGLISLLSKLLTTTIDSCEAIFGAILSTINGILNKKVNIPIPGMLLVLSELLPGYSTDRALINVTEALEGAGVPTGPLYGRANTLPMIVKSILDGHTQEMDQNGYGIGAPQPVILPSTPAGTVITPESFRIIFKQF